MKKISLVFLLLSIFSLNLFADSEEDERRRIIEQYGSADTKNKEAKEDPSIEELEESIRQTVQDLQTIPTGHPSQKDSAEQNTIEQDSDSKDLKSHYRSRELKDSYMTNAMNEMMKSMFKEFLKENPLSKMSHSEVRGIISGKLNNLPIGKFLENNPKVLEFIVVWLRDKRALPRLLSVVNEPERMKIYGTVCLVVLVISFFLNLFNSKGNLFKRILKKLLIVIGVTTVNLTVFCVMFKSNVMPSIDILFQFLKA